MFVTINAKHTRLNASHLVSLSGRQLYSDESLAAAHDIVRALNDREDSPLHGEIKLLGVGKGRVAQAPLAQELKKLFAADAFGAGRKGDAFREESKRFFVNYLKQAAGDCALGPPDRGSAIRNRRRMEAPWDNGGFPVEGIAAGVAVPGGSGRVGEKENC
jgi:hypothetical protein